MDKKVKKQWVKALRSGKYKQGTGALLREGKFCCLGVLCSVNKLKRSQQRDGYGRFVSSAILFDNSDSALPKDFRKKVKITPRQQSKLIKMNDGGFNGENKKSFKEIADWIDENL